MWQYTALTYSFSSLEPVCCSMSSSNCCFLTCIQVSQEAGQEVWYSHHFQNFPKFIVIHTAKDFGIENKAEIDVFWNSLAFSMIQWMLAIWYAEYIMQNARLDEAQARIKIARRNINNLRYADDTTLLAKVKKTWRASLWQWKRRVKKLA